MLELGNQVGKDQAVYLWSLNETVEVRLTPWAIVWELTLGDNRYKLVVTPF